MTHDDITANRLLNELPQEAREKLHTLATRRKVPMTALIKEGLLKIAKDINRAARARKPAEPAGPGL